MGYFRKPKTRQELVQFHADDVDCQYEDDFPRPRRKRRHIPTEWDDVWSKRSRSWKSYRKTQWKEKVVKEKKGGKFRGHLNPRRMRQTTKKSWFWNPEVGRYYTYDVIWFWEGTKEKKVQSYARLVDKRDWLIWDIEKEVWISLYR